MQVPMSWLRTLVDTPLSTNELAEVLTIGGIEVEDIIRVGAFNPKVVMGIVTEILAVDKAEEIYLFTIDVGELIPVVSKQPSSHALVIGARLAVALPGAILIDAQAACFSTRQVVSGTRYGQLSQGVLCSEAECGVGDKADEVMTLNVTQKAGAPLVDCLKQTDQWQCDEILVIAILANIARCQSMDGVAKEVAALTGATLTSTSAPSCFSEVPATLKPQSDVPELCRRFSSCELANVSVSPSPHWLQRRLALAGITPINNLVDASNYTMLELGQPTHAYDLTTLASTSLVARLAQTGETLRTLVQDEEEAPVVLNEEHLVIADDKRVVAIAGIMGGHDTAISASTTTVLLESANFDLINIRKTQSALKLFTDASARFSRGVVPTQTLPAMARYVELVRLTCPNLSINAFGDTIAKETADRVIALSAKEVNDALGMDFTINAIAKLLERVALPCSVSSKDGTLTATVSSSREDIHGVHDLIEEVARLYGFDKLPATMPCQPIAEHPRNKAYEWRENMRDAMVLWGFHEAITYSFTAPEIHARLFAGREAPVESPPFVTMKNPLNAERASLRRSLLPGLIEHAQQNLRHSRHCELFEIGPVFLPEIPAETAGLPTERDTLAAVLVGSSQNKQLHQAAGEPFNFYDASDALGCLLNHLHIAGITLQAEDCAPYHPGQCARVMHQNTCLGHIGALHPLVSEAFGIKKQRVFAFELDVAKLAHLAVGNFSIQDIPKVPSIELDVSLIMDDALPAHWVLDLMRRTAKDLWQHGDVFDVYTSAEKLGPAKKALAIRFSLNAKTRTLTMEEANATREKIVAVLEEEIGATLRSS